MHTTDASFATKFKVGLFTLIGLAFIVALTVFVNDKPYWYRPCQLVNINVDDATGLKMKSPVRSLGLQIGYLSSVELTETHVSLGICITAPVEVLPSTRAYLRGEGFLGDKFVELKPVKYVGKPQNRAQPSGESSQQGHLGRAKKAALALLAVLIPDASAEETQPTQEGRPVRRGGREIPVGAKSEDMQQVVNRVDELVDEMTKLTSNLKQAINPEELRQTMRQLNRTLENASRTLSPEGGLNQTAQRTLAKLEDAIEQLRSIMVRVNKGEGSVGMLLNDPTYAEEIRDVIKNANRLLSKVSGVRFVVDLGAAHLTGYHESRGWFQLQIWPKPHRYYLLGISQDPRGRLTEITETVTTGGFSVTTERETVEKTGLLITAMVGQIFFGRVDISAGALFGDGAASASFWLGRETRPNELELRSDIYSKGSGLDSRISVTVRPFMDIYLRAGIESFKKVGDAIPYFFGGGVAFDDEDIKLLFALR